jgi:5-methyltetrahydropteroyltriglutamate--homocysteine methyltransferase
VTLGVDNYYLEFDSPRVGGFEPLRFMPHGKSVVLGLITTKRAQLGSVDEICRRIEQASRQIPLDRQAISPQCGFSGEMMSDVMSIDAMEQKLGSFARLPQRFGKNISAFVALK